jgi:hypothetical protein
MTRAAAMRPSTAGLRALLAPHEPPCVSLYELTHRSYPASSQEDPVRYRNLLHRAEDALRERYPARPEPLSVADRFLIKPLIRSLQRDGRYQLLALSLAEARLYEGSRDTLAQPQSVPRGGRCRTIWRRERCGRAGRRSCSRPPAGGIDPAAPGTARTFADRPRAKLK